MPVNTHSKKRDKERKLMVGLGVGFQHRRHRKKKLTRVDNNKERIQKLKQITDAEHKEQIRKVIK